MRRTTAVWPLERPLISLSGPSAKSPTHLSAPGVGSVYSRSVAGATVYHYSFLLATPTTPAQKATAETADASVPARTAGTCSGGGSQPDDPIVSGSPSNAPGLTDRRSRAERPRARQPLVGRAPDPQRKSPRNRTVPSWIANPRRLWSMRRSRIASSSAAAWKYSASCASDTVAGNRP